MSASLPAIEFAFDIASPYSYLASEQVDALAERLGTSAVWHPVLLGGIFAATGNAPPATVPARGRYMLKDLHAWAAVYGIPFSFPASFPANSLLAQRTLVAIDRLQGQERLRAASHALFRAYWADGQDPTLRETIERVLGHAGFDVGALLDAAVTPENKDALKARTQSVIDRGAFGVPTLFVRDRMYFGNDRLQLLEAEFPDGTPGLNLIAPTEWKPGD